MCKQGIRGNCLATLNGDRNLTLDKWIFNKAFVWASSSSSPVDARSPHNDDFVLQWRLLAHKKKLASIVLADWCSHLIFTFSSLHLMVNFCWFFHHFFRGEQFKNHAINSRTALKGPGNEASLLLFIRRSIPSSPTVSRWASTFTKPFQAVSTDSTL